MITEILGNSGLSEDEAEIAAYEKENPQNFRDQKPKKKQRVSKN